MTKSTGVGRGSNPASWNNTRRGAAHCRWNSDLILSEHGYVRVRVGVEHPLADPNGYAYEHLVVWCAAGHARPGAGELLHHKNEDKTDNRYSNLELTGRSEHSAHHIAARRRDATGRLLDGVLHDGVPT